MKIIDWDDKIASLENVRDVVALTSCKDGYTIRINYMDNNFTCFLNLSLTAKNVLMNDIKRILEKA